MRSLVLLAAATALTLAACQRPAEETSPPITAEDAVDAQPTTAEPDRTTPPAAAPTKASSAPRKADAAADEAAADVAATAPAADGPSPAVRDGAKQAAEETNLHPRTP